MQPQRLVRLHALGVLLDLAACVTNEWTRTEISNFVVGPLKALILESRASSEEQCLIVTILWMLDTTRVCCMPHWRGWWCQKCLWRVPDI